MSRPVELGQEIEVLDSESGVWRLGTCLQVCNDEFLVHYKGWSKTFDETVNASCIRVPALKPQTKRTRSKPFRFIESQYKIDPSIKPAFLVKDDTFHFRINDQVVTGTVNINDPFNEMVKGTFADKDGKKELNVCYSDICAPGVTEISSPTEAKVRKTTTCHVKRQSSKHGKTSKTQKSAVMHEPIHVKSQEVTQFACGDSVICCGDFLLTNETNLFHFVTKLTLEENGKCKVYGHVVRCLGEKSLTQCGKFESYLENQERASLKVNSYWRERIRMTQLAAEQRLKTDGKGNSSDVEQRRAALRRQINKHLQAGLTGKQRHIKFCVPYHNRVDGDLLGIDIANGFREEFSPESFETLDRLLGGKWDFKLKDTGKYSFVSRICFRLIPSTQDLEINANIVSNSFFDWRQGYRLDTLQSIIYANSLE